MHSEKYNQGKVRLVSLVSFFLGFLDAFLIYILSEYFAVVSGSTNVGIFYVVAYTLVLASLFGLRPLVTLIGQSRTLYLALGLSILACALLTSLPPSALTLGLLVLFIAITNLTWVTLDMVLESFSLDGFSGRIRGLYLTIMNAGLLAAPFLSTHTLDRFDYGGVFFVLLIGYIILFIIALIGFRSDNHVESVKLSVGLTLQKLWREKNLFHIYHVSFAMDFFYALMIVYVPLHLRSLGFLWTDIGLIFTVMLLPFVVLQYPLGRLADRFWGEKEMLAASIVIAIASTAVIPFLETTHWVVWALVLLATRVGIAGIEVLRDSYFYKQIDASDLDVIAFFRTSRPVANIVAAFLAFLFLLFLPLQGIFFIIVAVLTFSLVSVFLLTDTRSERERILLSKAEDK